MKRVVERTIYNNVIIAESIIEKEDIETSKIFNELSDAYEVSTIVESEDSRYFIVEIDWNNALEVRLEKSI